MGAKSLNDPQQISSKSKQEAGRSAVGNFFKEVGMRETNHNWGYRVAAIMAVAMGLFFLGQLVSFWWIAVWMMIWLWPERVPERIEPNRMASAQRLVKKKDSYAGGD
jgi:hypothetical protein